MPQVLQEGTPYFKMQVYSHLAKVSIQMANLNLRDPSEKLSSFETPADDNDFNFYKRKAYLQASNYLKEALTIAVELNHLKTLRESFYLLSLTCSFLTTVTNQADHLVLNNKKELAASMFLHVDKIVAGNCGSVAVYQAT